MSRGVTEVNSLPTQKSGQMHLVRKNQNTGRVRWGWTHQASGSQCLVLVLHSPSTCDQPVTQRTYLEEENVLGKWVQVCCRSTTVSVSHCECSHTLVFSPGLLGDELRQFSLSGTHLTQDMAEITLLTLPGRGLDSI